MRVANRRYEMCAASLVAALSATAASVSMAMTVTMSVPSVMLRLVVMGVNGTKQRSRRDIEKVELRSSNCEKR